MKDKNQLLSWGKFLIGWPLSVISIAFIVKLLLDKSSGLDFSSKHISVSLLGLSVLAFYFYYILRSYLWRVILEEKGHKDISFFENTYRFAFSELKRYTPGNIWSILSRASQFKEVGVDNKSVGVAIIADAQLVIIGCAIVSLGALQWLLNLPDELKSKVITLSPFILLVLIGWFVGTGTIYRNKYSKSENLLSNLVLPSFSLNSKIKITAISVITYAVFGVGNYLAFASVFGMNQNPVILSSFFVFALLIGFLSFITPMGLGVREAVVTLGLSQAMSLGSAGFASIFTRIVLVCSELSFLFIVFLWKKFSQK